MLNQITIMGRLTRDPEIRTAGQSTVANFTLACDRDFKDKTTGEKATDFIDVVAWRATAEFAQKYFTKGRMAVVSGRLQIRDWTDKDGTKRRSAEIVAENLYFGDSKPKDENDAPPQNYGQNQPYNQPQGQQYAQNQGQQYQGQPYGQNQGQPYHYPTPPNFTPDFG